MSSDPMEPFKKSQFWYGRVDKFDMSFVIRDTTNGKLGSYSSHVFRTYIAIIVSNSSIVTVFVSFSEKFNVSYFTKLKMKIYCNFF